jgi:hypothetical protein
MMEDVVLTDVANVNEHGRHHATNKTATVRVVFE